MRAVDHGFVRALAALDTTHDVVRGDDLGVDFVVGREGLALEHHRLELARLRLLLQCLEIQPGRLEQIHRNVALDPRFHRRVHGGGMVAHHIELGVGIGVGHGRPAIGSRCGLVDDQHAGGALAGGLFVLVRPATVIGHGLAAEVTHAGLEVRIVDEHHGDLAVQVHTLEVVPVALRCLHAVADEHQRRVVDRHGLGAIQCGTHGDFLALGEVLGFAVDVERQRRLADDVRLQQRYGLGPFALAVLEVAARLDTRGLELGNHVVDGLGLAFRGRSATLEGVGGQGFDLVRQAVRVDGRSGRGRGEQRRRHRQGEQG